MQCSEEFKKFRIKPDADDINFPSMDYIITRPELVHPDELDYDDSMVRSSYHYFLKAGKAYKTKRFKDGWPFSWIGGDFEDFLRTSIVPFYIRKCIIKEKQKNKSLHSL